MNKTHDKADAILGEVAVMAQGVADSPCAYCGKPITAEGLSSAVRSDVDSPAWAHRACWDRHMAYVRITNKYGTYGHNNEWIDAPGACQECCAGQRGEIEGHDWGKGHFACRSVPDDILQAAKDGIIGGIYHNNTWRWW